jgi:UDP-N-acetylmuramate dehydrogenase
MSNIKFNYNLSKNSWFGLGGAAKKYFSPSNEEELIDYLKNNLDERLITIGSGSNILFRDKGCLETIIKLGKGFQKIEIKNEKIHCGAAVLKSQLSKFAYENSIKNYEFLSCIPGTVGGGVIMNAGCFHFEFKDIVTEVEGINKKGDKIYMQNKEIEFDYRQTKISEDIIITKIIFKVFKGDKKFDIRKN